MTENTELNAVGGIAAELLTKPAVASLLSVSTRTIDNLKSKGVLPYIKLSQRCIRYPRQAVLEAMRRLTVAAN